MANLALVFASDKTAATIVAKQLLAWARARETALLPDDFEMRLLDTVGEVARAVHAGVADSENRGAAQGSDAAAMAPTVLARTRCWTDLTLLEQGPPGGETWKDVWETLALEDNHVHDKCNQKHAPPEQLDAMQAAGIHPIRCAPWLLMGRNWHGNMNWNDVGGGFAKWW